MDSCIFYSLNGNNRDVTFTVNNCTMETHLKIPTMFARDINVIHEGEVPQNIVYNVPENLDMKTFTVGPLNIDVPKHHKLTELRFNSSGISCIKDLDENMKPVSNIYVDVNAAVGTIITPQTICTFSGKENLVCQMQYEYENTLDIITLSERPTKIKFQDEEIDIKYDQYGMIYQYGDQSEIDYFIEDKKPIFISCTHPLHYDPFIPHIFFGGEYEALDTLDLKTGQFTRLIAQYDIEYVD